MADNLAIPKSAITSVSTNEYAALLYLNPSVTKPPGAKGKKKVVAQPAAVNGAAEEAEEPEAPGPSTDERDKTIADLTAELEKLSSDVSAKDEAHAKVASSLGLGSSRR